MRFSSFVYLSISYIYIHLRQVLAMVGNSMWLWIIAFVVWVVKIAFMHFVINTFVSDE